MSEELMQGLVRAVNSIVPFDYLRINHEFTDSMLEDLVQRACEGIDNQIYNLDTDKIESLQLKHCRDIRYELSNEWFFNLYNILDDLKLDSELAYKIGRHYMEIKPIGDKMALTLMVLGLSGAYKLGNVFNRKWNKTKEVDIRKTGRNKIEIVLKHYEGILVNDFALNYHRGIFDITAERLGYQNVVSSFTKVDDPKREIYRFLVKYKNIGLRKRRYNARKFNDPDIQNLVRKYEGEISKGNQQNAKQQKLIEEKTAELVDTIQTVARLEGHRAAHKRNSAGLAHELGNVWSIINNYLKVLMVDIDNKRGPQVGDIQKPGSSLAKLYSVYNYVLEDLTGFLTKHGVPDDAITKELLPHMQNLRDVCRPTDSRIIAVDKIVYGVLRQSERIKQIEKNAKIYADVLHEKRGTEKIDYAKLVSTVVKDHETDLAQHGIILNLKTHGENFIIIGSDHQLYSITNNPLMNSIYSVKNRDEKTIDIDIFSKEKTIEFIISDTGTGIGKKILPKIFDFKYTTKGNEGSGMGLTIFDAYLQLYSGTRKVESHKDKGTRLTAVLMKK